MTVAAAHNNKPVQGGLRHQSPGRGAAPERIGAAQKESSFRTTATGERTGEPAARPKQRLPQADRPPCLGETQALTKRYGHATPYRGGSSVPPSAHAVPVQ
jgi:hypothetical protein